MEPEFADYEIAQFVIPRRAFAAINAAAIEEQARADGIERPRIEANTRHAGGNNVRLTTRVVMARRIVEAIEAATQFAERRGDVAMVADLEIALATALKGIDQARSRIDTRPPMGDTGYLGA